MTEFEAYEALALLLRLCQLVGDNWHDFMRSWIADVL